MDASVFFFFGLIVFLRHGCFSTPPSVGSVKLGSLESRLLSACVAAMPRACEATSAAQDGAAHLHMHIHVVSGERKNEG